MPRSMTPLMVDLDAVRQAIGCKDEALIRAVIDASDLADDDTDVDEFEEAEEGDEDVDLDDIDALPSSQEALRHIVMGGPWARGIGSKYGYAFLALCRHLGEPLDCPEWCETRGEYVAAFGRMLAGLGVPRDVLDLDALTDGPGDFPLPPRTDAPFIGALTPEQAARAAAALAAVDRDALAAASRRIKISRGAVEPEFVVACFDELRGWCEACAAAGKGLLVFYY